MGTDAGGYHNEISLNYSAALVPREYHDSGGNASKESLLRDRMAY